MRQLAFLSLNDVGERSVWQLRISGVFHRPLNFLGHHCSRTNLGWADVSSGERCAPAACALRSVELEFNNGLVAAVLALPGTIVDLNLVAGRDVFS
jgi:hypothetical protein